MKTPRCFRYRLPWAGLAVLFLPCLALVSTGCMAGTDMDSEDTVKAIDPFPKPQGPKMIPLEGEIRSSFLYTGLDPASRPNPIPNLILYISPRGGDMYTYAFEDSTQGYLVKYRAAPPEDSMGVYIVGTYRKGGEVLDSTPTLWLPQHPRPGTSWPIGSNRTMELVDGQAVYYTETLFPQDTAGSPVAQGFQRHAAYLFRETAGDTVTYYHFRKGVGCLGFERSAGGRLLASGSLRSFYRPNPRP